MNKKITILFAEDHVSVREAITTVLNEELNMQVIGEADHGKALLKLLRKVSADIVITDLEMPEMNGFELIKNVKAEFPGTKIICYSMYSSEYFVSEVIRGGANAFVSKGDNIETLIKTINQVYREGYYFSESTSRLIISSMIHEKKLNSLIKQLSLSHRENEVLGLICDGKTNKQIGECLGIEPSTVDFHRKNIYKKTNSANIIELVKYSIKNGITKVE